MAVYIQLKLSARCAGTVQEMLKNSTRKMLPKNGGFDYNWYVAECTDIWQNTD